VARLWPIAGCERAARKRRIRDMDTPRRKRRHSETKNTTVVVVVSTVTGYRLLFNGSIFQPSGANQSKLVKENL